MSIPWTLTPVAIRSLWLRSYAKTPAAPAPSASRTSTGNAIRNRRPHEPRRRARPSISTSIDRKVDAQQRKVTAEVSGRCRQTFDRVECAPHLVLVQGDVLELAGEVLVVRAHVEMAVTGEVEEDRSLLPRLVGLLRDLERAVDRV